jgi:hypothetical protein
LPLKFRGPRSEISFLFARVGPTTPKLIGPRWLRSIRSTRRRPPNASVDPTDARCVKSKGVVCVRLGLSGRAKVLVKQAGGEQSEGISPVRRPAQIIVVLFDPMPQH